MKYPVVLGIISGCTRGRLRPLTEVLGNHQNVPESLRCMVTEVQDVHGDTVPAMTGGDIA